MVPKILLKRAPLMSSFRLIIAFILSLVAVACGSAGLPNLDGATPDMGDPSDGTGDKDDPEGPGDGEPGLPSGGPCQVKGELACGGSVSGNTADDGMPRLIDRYACTTWNASGPEIAYSFSPTDNGIATAALIDVAEGQDLDIYVLDDLGEGCHSDGCITYGDVDAPFEYFAGKTYYLVVDGYLDAAGSFSLTLDCTDPLPGDDDDSVGDDDDAAPPVAEICDDEIDNDGDGRVDCGDSDCAADLSCTGGVCNVASTLSEGSSVEGANDEAGSTSVVGSYSCEPSWDESGPEYVYQYVATMTGEATLAITETPNGPLEYLFGSFDDLDLFVLDGTSSCDPNSCVVAGDTAVTWNVTTGSSWYLVVDGFEGDVSSYILSLSVDQTGPGSETDCSNGVDDDGDASVDCDDSDCSNDVACTGTGDDDDASGGPATVVSGLGLPADVPPVGNTGTRVLSSSSAPSGVISDLNVNLDITHTYMSDLSATLTSPSGTSVLLFDGLTSCCQNMSGTTFDDQASSPITSSSPPYSGVFQPLQSLSAFQGEDSAGVWTLTVEDDVVGDSGTINVWTLEFQY
jgi:subtilisin-like proprotein convertase family protein